MKCVLVDDDRNLIEALKRQLENQFEIETCISAERALKIIASDPDVAVVVTDFKMPKLDGLEFLKMLHTKAPVVVPIMLTGVGDMKTAMQALNDGHVFRFLTKPCSPVELTKALSDALSKFSHNKAERELLEGTLAGSVKVLTDILSIIDPLGFEQCQTMRQSIRELAKEIGNIPVWEAELASMLLELGSLVIPTPIIVKYRTSQTLTEEEQKLWARVPEVSAKLIKQVPRLSGVAEIIRRHREDYRPKEGNLAQELPKAARLIRIVKDIIRSSENGLGIFEAIKFMKAAENRYDLEILNKVEAYYQLKSDSTKQASSALTIQIYELECGQKTACDVVTKDGVTLVKSGTVLDDTLIERIKNYEKFVGLKELPSVEKL